MELPANIKRLYKHWGEHVAHAPTTTAAIPSHLQWFISERQAIWEKKTLGHAAPFTTDPILQNYRFCNIFRELDRQTIEYHTLLQPLQADFPLWLLNMFYARLVARPATIKATGFLSFNKKGNDHLKQQLLALPRPRYGTPYVFPISVIQQSATPTREQFLTEYLPTIIPRIAKEIRTWKKLSVSEALQTIIPLFGFNLRFLWTEVLIDVAYQYPEHLNLFRQFPIGPGSAPTFASLAPDQDASHVVATLAAAQYTTTLTYNGQPLALSAENWEGIGCEYRKYTNLSRGQGRKRRYAQSGVH